LSLIRDWNRSTPKLLLGLPAESNVYGTRIYDYIRQSLPLRRGHRARLVFATGTGGAAVLYRRYLQGNRKIRRGDRQGYSVSRVKLARMVDTWRSRFRLVVPVMMSCR